MGFLGDSWHFHRNASVDWVVRLSQGSVPFQPWDSLSNAMMPFKKQSSNTGLYFIDSKLKGTVRVLAPKKCLAHIHKHAHIHKLFLKNFRLKMNVLNSAILSNHNTTEVLLN